MSSAVIEVKGISKRYVIGPRRSRTFREQVDRWFNRMAGRPEIRQGQPVAAPETIWALKNISFSLRSGEVLGIIGANGAGKSTLLKILSRITEPTEGRAVIRGRVTSLLEVGTGFHPELSGRENAYLNGAILGMSRSEMDARIGEITAFAELEKFMDMPVKHYSSGMYVRLAFAVAAHLDPDILIIDEVLAVGDIAFQKKCLEKIKDPANSHRAVLFVSHNLQIIPQICSRAILIHEGQMLQDGEVRDVIQRYRMLVEPGRKSVTEFHDAQKKFGVLRAKITTSDPEGKHRFGQPLKLDFEMRFPAKTRVPYLSFQVFDMDGRGIIHMWKPLSVSELSEDGLFRARCVIPKLRLYMGSYMLVTHVADAQTHEHYEALHGICSFEVTMEGTPREYYSWWKGSCAYIEEGEWNVELLSGK